MPTPPELTDFLTRATFVAFDTETTGLWASSHRLVELGAVKFSLGSDREELFESFVNPDRPIPPEVIRIHGITDEMVAEAPPVSDVLREFIKFCGPEAILMAHNAPFDVSFLYHELRRSKLRFGDNPVIDTLDIFKRFYPDCSRYSLLALATEFGVTDSQNHRALDDARIVRHLFSLAAGKLGAIESLARMEQSLSVLKIDSSQRKIDRLPAEQSDINRAIEESRRLEIEYAKPDEAPVTRIIRPETVQQQSGNLYLIGYCELVQAERTFRLDRIINFRLLD